MPSLYCCVLFIAMVTQPASFRVSGVVTDPSGASVPGANVKLLDAVGRELNAQIRRDDEETVSRLTGVPKIVVLDAFTSGSAQQDETSSHYRGEFGEILSWSHGKHFLRIGALVPYLARRASNDMSGRFGTFRFSSLADYEAGEPYSFTRQIGNGRVVFWKTEFAGFVQDEFRIRDNLSLGLGLRYEAHSHPSDRNDFAPRLSVAWAPGEQRSTVIRAGGGVFSFPADNYDLSGEWGRAGHDRRHRFRVFGAINAGSLFNLGLRLRLESGAPYSLTTGRDENQDSRATDRPEGVRRNSLEGPGRATIDLRWSKEFALGESSGEGSPPSFRIALDAFNALNQVNYTDFVGNMSSPFFGEPVGARSARRMQVSLRFKF